MENMEKIEIKMAVDGRPPESLQGTVYMSIMRDADKVFVSAAIGDMWVGKYHTRALELSDGDIRTIQGLINRAVFYVPKERKRDVIKHTKCDEGADDQAT